MIESNIINWIDLGDSMQNLDVYGHKKWLHFFNIMRVLVGYKTFSVFFYIILKFFFFLQIIMLTLANINDDNDSAVEVLKYISKVILVQEIVTDKESYKICVIVNSVLTVIIIFCVIYLLISISIGKFISKLPVHFFNFVNLLVMNYLIGPIVQIGIMAFNCEHNVHKFLNVSCYSHWLHWVMLVVSIINVILWVSLSVLLSIYYNEIGSVNETKVCARINCNYDFVVNIAKILMFVFAYILHNYGGDSETLRVIFEVYVFLNGFGFCIYVYKEVLFYDERINKVVMFGWVFTTWFAFVIVIKSLLDVVDTTIFILLGWVVLAFIIYFLEEARKEFLLTDFNIFEVKSLKNIELFNSTLLGLINQRSVKAKTMLVGLTKKFEDYYQNNPEIKEKFIKLSSNEHLKKQFNSNSALPILSIVYILYDHHLEKSILKNDILLNICYFLMNKFKNPTFAVYLCSKVKVESNKHLYYKYVLMEEIKEFFVNKLSKQNNKESVKQVQIGSVILYNIYVELFKIKIYDAACNQIDYFDILKNNMTNAKTTENFLKIGEDILTLRKEILQIWEKIVDLNPFSDESEKDYMLYLETILQDDILARQEAKKFSTLKNNKLSERNNIYHSMFIRELSSVILVDGYSIGGKFLYTTPNFPTLFNFSAKEILNMCVDDLLPNVVAGFHKELVENAIKYSNINYIFNVQKDFLLKGKSGGIFNVKLYAKSVPNLSYGFIYMVQIAKIQDHNYIIVLDKDFKINGLTNMVTQGGEMYTMNNNYGLTQGLYGHHIALALPEILSQMEYHDGQFSIQKSDIDLKGNLYPVVAYKDFDLKVESVLDKIKQKGRLEIDDENGPVVEYEDLIKEISMRYQKSFSVFYKIITKSFLDGKYKYYRVYITNDIIALNENSHNIPSAGGLTGSQAKKSKLLESSSKGDNKVSGKQIKLKVGDKETEKQQLLLDDDKEKDNEEKKDEDKEKNNSDLDKKQKQIDNRNTLRNSSHPPSSLFTRSSIDSASFNKLKNGILEKKEITSVKIMKLLCLCFVALTIILIVLNSSTIENNFENLRDYLQQNLFFNHTKISVSCVYLSTLNLKWVKDGYIDDNVCDLNETCTLFYSSLLSNCIDDIKLQKENASYFYEDFKVILDVAKDIELDVFNLTTKDKLSVDIDNLLNLLISNGLKLNSNLDLYYDGENLYDINSLNLLDQSIGFIDDEHVVGFDDEAKSKKVSEHFSPLPSALIIDCVFVVVIFLLFGYLIFKLNDMEKFYLDKLIKFHTPNFEFYLKSLEELKKKLRNDNGDDDDKLNGDMEIGEMSSKKSKKEDDEDKKEKKKEKKEEDEEEKEHNRKKKAKKAKGNRQNKIQQQRNEKKKIMSKFFFTWNLLLTIKILLSLIISFSYYIVVSLLESKKKEDYLSFDGTTDSIEGVYKNSFDIFLSLKKELAQYENFEVEKTKAIRELKKGNSVTINDKEYTSVADITEIEALSGYNMSIPNNNEIVVPKLENLLMPLVNDLNGASDATNLLNELYNKDACLVLFGSTESKGYQSCSVFWSGIIVKGMEQAITQMGVVVNTVIDELNSLNLGKKEFEEIVDTSSAFSQYEIFVEYYLFYAYMKTVDLFSELKSVKVDSIYDTFRIILYIYIVGVICLFFILIFFVFSSKRMFNTFLNFVGILPVKYLVEDEGLYKDVLKLEQHIF